MSFVGSLVDLVFWFHLPTSEALIKKKSEEMEEEKASYYENEPI
jgi:hypothetical protein